MANDTLPLDPQTFTMLNASAVSAIRIQVQSGRSVHLIASADTTPPTDIAGSVSLDRGQGSYLELSEWFPGIETGHIFAWSPGPARISIWHE